MNNEVERTVTKSGAGYVLINPDQLDRNLPKNVHVLPAKVFAYNDGTRGWSITQRETCCGLPTNEGQLSCIKGEMFFKSESRLLRNRLAKLQNDGTRICGNCVSHFYADYLDEK